MKTIACGIAGLLIAILLIGCSANPSVIRGEVVMRTETGAHINLGSADGVQVGDTLTVFRFDLNAPGVRSTEVGKVSIVSVIDKHYSAVEVLRGTLYERDIVEKQQR